MTREDHIKDLKKYDDRHENNGFKLSIIIYRHERRDIKGHLWSVTDACVVHNFWLLIDNHTWPLWGIRLTVMRNEADRHEKYVRPTVMSNNSARHKE